MHALRQDVDLTSRHYQHTVDIPSPHTLHNPRSRPAHLRVPSPIDCSSSLALPSPLGSSAQAHEKFCPTTSTTTPWKFADSPCSGTASFCVSPHLRQSCSSVRSFVLPLVLHCPSLPSLRHRRHQIRQHTRREHLSAHDLQSIPAETLTMCNYSAYYRAFNTAPTAEH